MWKVEVAHGRGVIESAPFSGEDSLSDYKVGDRITVKLLGGRLVTAVIRANVETTEGERLQVSFGNETARIYLWQVVERLR